MALCMSFTLAFLRREALRDGQSNGPKLHQERGDCISQHKLQDVEFFARRLILFCCASSMQRKFRSVTIPRACYFTQINPAKCFSGYAYSFSYLAEVFAILKMYVQMYQLNVKHKEKKSKTLKVRNVK